MTEIEKKFQTIIDKVENELSDIAREYFYATGGKNEQKNDGSVVTLVDLEIERQLKICIKDLFPKDAIYGEEEGYTSGDSGFVWVIDPIDGTDNFVRKIPFFAITAARLGRSDEGSFAIIHNPVSRQTFTTFGTDSLFENGNCRLAMESPVGNRLLVTVSGSNTSGEWVGAARQNLSRALYLEFGKSGHYHSSLLEYAYVAVGRVDGFLQLLAKAWDQAAGLLLVRASGGSISVWSGNEWIPYKESILDLYGEDMQVRPTILVTRPEIHDRALSFIGNPEKWGE